MCFSPRKEVGKLNNLRTHYCSKIEDVKTSIEESEETVNEVLREAKTSTKEVSVLSKTVSFSYLKIKMSDFSFHL